MQRRAFLKGLGAAAVAAAAVRPGLAQAYAPVRLPDAPFAPVHARPDRIIRTITGLRPFRKPGFRLEAERFGDKTLVHNYGHGGAGVTLSWGCSEIAARLAATGEGASVAVLGAGVIGLTTARLLIERGAEVTLYAETFPPDTTSNVAGALWYPTTLYDDELATEAFRGLLDHVSQRSFLAFQHFANDPRYGVFWIRHHQMRDRPFSEPRPPMPGGDALYPGLVRSQSGAGPFGFPHWEAYYTLMIDPDLYLRARSNDLLAAGAKMVQRRFEDPSDVAALPQRIVVNCTGLGAGALFGDAEMLPVKGQLTLLLPQPEIDYGYAGGNPVGPGFLYMFPRKSAIVLGGTNQRGEWDLAIDPAEAARVIEGHAAIAARA